MIQHFIYVYRISKIPNVAFQLYSTMNLINLFILKNRYLKLGYLIFNCIKRTQQIFTMLLK